MNLKKGDYVEPIISSDAFLCKDPTGMTEEDLKGIVISDADKKWIKIYSLRTNKIHIFLKTYFEKAEIPKEDLKAYLTYIKEKLSIVALDNVNNIVLKGEFYDALVSYNPIMDELRKNNCLCLNCELMTKIRETNCNIANQLYEISVKNDMAMAITRCKKYVLKK